MRHTLTTAALLALAGCSTPTEPPQGFRVVARDGTLLPAACMAPTQRVGRPFLRVWPDSGGTEVPPPGCSQALVLQKQVERPTDLLRGRVPEDPPGGPAARAVDRYLARSWVAGPAAPAAAPPPQSGARTVQDDAAPDNTGTDGTTR